MIRRIPLLLCLMLLVMPMEHAFCQPVETARRDAFHRQAESVLSQPKYRMNKPTESIWHRVGDWLSRLWKPIGQALERLFRLGGRIGPGTQTIIFWIVFALLAVGLGWVLSNVIRSRLARMELDSSRRQGITGWEELLERPTNSLALLTAADERLQAGDLKPAYQLFFIALLLKLDECHIIRFERSRANGEYVRETRDQMDVGNWFGDTVLQFDDRVYGNRQVSRSDCEGLRGLIERMTRPATNES